MLAFTLLLLVITGLLLSGSSFAIIPLGGNRSLMPISLIIVATITMMWTLRHWTDMSRRRALLSLLISLSTTRVIAIACLEGIARRDGVFLRTSKAGGNKHRIRTALRLSRWESLLAGLLYASAGLLATLRHPPLLLIAIVSLQGTVYLCGPIAALWNLRAQRVAASEYRRRFHEQRVRLATRRRTWSRIPSVAAASLLTLCAGGLAGALFGPVSLLRADPVAKIRISPQALVHPSEGTEVYLRIGNGAATPGRTFYPVTSVDLSQGSDPGVSTLSFATSSSALLDEVVTKAVAGGRVSPLTFAVRRPGTGREATTELIDTFNGAVVSSFQASLSGLPSGEVTISLAGVGHLSTSRRALGGVGPFAQTTVPSKADTTLTYLKLGPGSASAAAYSAVNSVELARAAGSQARLSLSFETSSAGLLAELLREGGSGKKIPDLVLGTGRGGGSGRSLTTEELKESFYSASITSFDENLSGSPTGTVTMSLVSTPPRTSSTTEPAATKPAPHGAATPAHAAVKRVAPTSRQ
jgi:hypothetical protein